MVASKTMVFTACWQKTSDKGWLIAVPTPKPLTQRAANFNNILPTIQYISQRCLDVEPKSATLVKHPDSVGGLYLQSVAEKSNLCLMVSVILRPLRGVFAVRNLAGSTVKIHVCLTVVSPDY